MPWSLTRLVIYIASWNCTKMLKGLPPTFILVRCLHYHRYHTQSFEIKSRNAAQLTIQDLVVSLVSLSSDLYKGTQSRYNCCDLLTIQEGTSRRHWITCIVHNQHHNFPTTRLQCYIDWRHPYMSVIAILFQLYTLLSTVWSYIPM